MRASLILSSIASLIVSACTISASGPVIVTADTGQVLTGSYHATASDGAFSVTDGRLTCGGQYNSGISDRTISVPVRCSDGRTGTATLTRESPFAGHGHVWLNDGTGADVVFGQRAEGYRLRDRATKAAQSPPIGVVRPQGPAALATPAQSEVAQRRFDENMQLVKAARDLRNCVDTRSALLAHASQESAEIVARAALAACARTASAIPLDLLDELRPRILDAAILVVIAERAKPRAPTRSPTKPDPEA